MPDRAPSLDELLARARARLERVVPEHLRDEMREGALVVDVRDTAVRDQEGELPGAHVVDLTILEWRLAPSSSTRTFDVAPDRKVILVCSDGYSSSLAAARLQDLGVPGATDLVGGYRAWRVLQGETPSPSSFEETGVRASATDAGDRD